MKHKKNFSLPAHPSLSFLPSQPPTSWCAHGNADYVELLARSNFSFLMGASHPDEMVLRAKQLGYRGLALCDVNGLYGVVRGYQAAERPSLFDATELAAHDGYEPGRQFRYHVGSELTPFDSSPITLLPISKDGYSRLSRLITRVKRPAAKARLKLSIEDILEEAGHATGELLAMPLPPWNAKDLEKLVDAFGDRLYLPVHKDSTWESIQLAREAVAFEKRLGPAGLKLFATQRPLFHVPDRKPLHDIVTCILHGTTLDQAKTKLTLNSERYLRPLKELREIYRDRPDLLSRTLEISERLQFSLAELKYRYPQEALPPGKNSTQYLRELAEKGFQKRYTDSYIELNAAERARSTGRPCSPAQYRADARKQLEHELLLIQKLEYEDYFLTLGDICDYARDRRILHQGRGSAANSIVCFLIGLTAIDPIKLGLLFERFLSLERAEPPDIDIDFEHERREEVIQYIYRKYGAAHAAMVCTVVCFRSRMALREVSKAMGATHEQTDLLVKAMGREGLTQLMAQFSAESAATSSRQISKPTSGSISEPSSCERKYGVNEQKLRMILKMAVEIKGFPRHLGIHSGGFVISHEPVVDLVPVEAATMTDRYVIQWNKDDVATLGLMKLDILSLGMLTAIRKAFELLKDVKGITHDLSTIPQADPPTYAMIQKADTIGVFQIESRAQMSLLPRLRPREWYDLVVQVAIVRPGPIQGGLVHPYLKRRSGQEPITYAHPDLEPILSKTMGVPIFQEQVMQICVAVAGFTPGEADELRRVVSSAWRKKAVMHGLRQRLINGMLAHGVKPGYAEQIYKVIEGFSEYGFPESHAASFALLTYVSCWLKRHHPDIFAAALVNSQPMGFYPPRQLIADAGKNGVKFHALDIQHSDWNYTLMKPGHVRVGLRSIDGLSEADANILIEARCRRGPFQDIEDLVRRTRLSKKALGKLATAGALFTLSPDPRQTLFTLQGLDFNQQSFFYGTEPLGYPVLSDAGTNINALDNATILSTKTHEQEATASSDGRHSIPQENEWEHVVREFATKGFSLTNHPIAIIRKHVLQHQLVQMPAQTRKSNYLRGSVHNQNLPNKPTTNLQSPPAAPRSQYYTAAELPTVRSGTYVKLVGLRSLLQKPPTAKGVCFVSLEDETGIFNAIVMPDVYEKIRLILYTERILVIEGKLENQQGVIHVRAKDVRAFQPPQTQAIDGSKSTDTITSEIHEIASRSSLHGGGY